MPPATYRFGTANSRSGTIKDWVMIHKIKALYDDSQGLSIRVIGQELGLSRNTVRKYLRTDEAAIEATQLRFASFVMAYLREDFHLQDRAHAGRTGTQSAPALWAVNCSDLLYSPAQYLVAA